MILLFFLFLQSRSYAANIPGFLEVEAGLYRGGRPSDVNVLAELSIKTDIDLQGGDLENLDFARWIAWWEPGETRANIAAEEKAATALGIAFYNLQLNSLATVTHEEDQRIDQVLRLMGDATKRPLFVHCEHGKDRTGLVVALYRVKYQGWTAERAHQEWVDLGHGGFSQAFTGQLDTYFFEKVQRL